MSVDQLDKGSWEREGRQTWESIVSRMPSASPFLSLAWTGSWLAVFGRRLRSIQLRVMDGEREVIGTCLLTPRIRRWAVIPHVRVHLNTDGENEIESVIVEHNALLAVAGTEDVVAQAVAQHMCARRIDEFRVAGAGVAEVDRLTRAFVGWTADVEWHDAPFVDLNALRGSGRTHLDVLSRNSREQLRRSLARYTARGPLRIEAAQTVDDADAMFVDLIRLHEARWSAVGQSGAFANRPRREFHQRFIRHAMLTQNVQLLRVSVGEATIAVLYNLVANGRVNFYQSGLSCEADRHLKPGMVAHHLAVQYCLEHGFAEYDFLSSPAGEGRYKSSLASHTRRLGQLTLTRPGWRRRYFDGLRRLRNAARIARGAPERRRDSGTGDVAPVEVS
jgi:CelD/BcsL family acetyltransferase involved in cellulose biosynthesis